MIAQSQQIQNNKFETIDKIRGKRVLLVYIVFVLFLK